MTKKILSNLKVLSLAVILSLGLSYVYAWTGPTDTAPNGNVAAPLNTSTAAQTKPGDLTVNSISATQHCIGASCINAWPVGGSDNLGNHTATQDLNLSGKNITNANFVTTKNVLDIGGGATGIESSLIIMRDDESPTSKAKYIHANTNVIGFLNGAGTWLAYWRDSGDSWQAGNATVVGKITSASTAALDAGNVVATKDYVDAAVLAGGGGGLGVYTEASVLIGKLIRMRDISPDPWGNGGGEGIQYANAAGNVGTIAPLDRALAGSFFYRNATCTGTEYVWGGNSNGGIEGAYRSHLNGNSYVVSPTGSSCSSGGYATIYIWNFTTSSCGVSQNNADVCNYNTPAGKRLKVCGVGNCLIK
jgi:hypothetical protein